MSGNDDENDSEISNLQINFNKQQAKISALKELLRQTEAAHGKTTSSAQEKVKNIAHRLTHLKSRARSRQSLDRSLSDVPIFEEDFSSPGSSARSFDTGWSSNSFSPSQSESPGSEKIQLLRQQMEQNKLKIAQRESSKREIEEMVVQLKAKMDSTQQSLERSSELGRSMTDLSSLSDSFVSNKYKSSSDLSFTPLNIDKEKIKLLDNRIRQLEKQLLKEKTLNDDSECKKELKILENKILDLEENLKAKECIIQARTQAVGLMSENLSSKGRNTVDLLETTRAELITMQTNFVDNEDAYREEINALKLIVKEKCDCILNLEEMNNILEQNRFELTVKISKLELESHSDDRMTILEQENASLENTITNLQKLLASNSPNESRNLIEVENIEEKFAALEKENDDLKKNLQEIQNLKEIPASNATIADKLRSLEAIIAIQKEEIQNHLSKIQEYEEQLFEKTVEYNVLNANFSVLEEKLKSAPPKSLFSKSSNEEADIEINKLKQQLDESNKSMIKTKLKTKQLQKQVDAFKKSSEGNSNLAKLTQKNQELQQNIIEMEDELGQLQLKLVGYESDNHITDVELANKVQILETTCQNQTSAIQLLQEEKLELCDSLQALQHSKQQDFEILHNDLSDSDDSDTRALISDFKNQILELETSIEKHKDHNQSIQELLEKSKVEKINLNSKVEHYIGENMELLDKIEKLNKSSSSAESIEIVERLTQQERLELEAFEQESSTKKLSYSATHVDKESATDAGGMGQELSDSLVKLREESSELMHKIELFTTERREVLDKMEILSAENQENLKQVEILQQEKLDLQNRNEVLELEKEEMESQLKSMVDENSKLQHEISALQQQNTDILNELSALQNLSIGSNTTVTDTIIDKCEASLVRLNTDIESFRKANDKNGKLQASKKLAKEAKNTVQQMDELFQKLKTKSELQVHDPENCENIVPNLQKEVDKSLENCAKKDKEINILNTEMLKFKILSEELNQKISEQELEHTRQMQILNEMQSDLHSKIEISEQEIKILKTLIAEQKQQLIESYGEHEVEVLAKIEQIQKCDSEIERLKTELGRSQNDSNDKLITELTNEITKLKYSLSKNEEQLNTLTSELNNKQETVDTLNAQIMTLYQTMEENTTKVMEKDDEISYIQELSNATYIEMKNLQKENDESKAQAHNLLTELQLQKDKVINLEKVSHLQEDVIQYRATITDLEKTNADLKHKNMEQVDKLKKFVANIKKKAAQCIELEEKVKFLENNRENRFPPQSDNILEANIRQLQERIDMYEYEMTNFKHANNLKVESLVADRTALEIKCTSMEYDLQNKLKEFEECQATIKRMINEIDSLNIARSQQSSIIADNNKKLTESEANINYLGIEILNKENINTELQKNIEHLNTDLQTKNVKIEKFRAVLKEKNREIQTLKLEKTSVVVDKADSTADELKHLELKYNELKDEHHTQLQSYMEERQSFQEQISKLKTAHDGNEAKLHENMGYIEVLETENKNYKDEILELEQCVASFEERRASIEKRANLLDVELQNKTNEFEKNEDALVNRLNILSEHDEIIAKRLLMVQEEKNEVAESLASFKQKHSELAVKFKSLEKEYETLETEKSLALSSENETLRNDLKTLHGTLEKEKRMYEESIAAKHLEIDNLENDLSVQLQAIESEKKSLKVKLERACDEIIDLKDESVKLKESVHALEQIKTDFERELTWTKMQNENLLHDQFELQELRMQNIQQKTDLDNWKHQHEILVQNHEIEVNTLRTQIAELDSMRMQVGQNQTDDQMFIETENKRLKDMLKEKEVAIDMYQKTNLQLQLSAISTAIPVMPVEPSNINSGDDNSQSIENVENARLKELNSSLSMELENVQAVLCTKNDDIKNLQIELSKLSNDVIVLSKSNSELQKKLTEMHDKNVTNPFDQSRANDQSISAFFSSNQLPNNAASFFDEVVVSEKSMFSTNSSKPPAQSVQNQKEIEDLQKNVSDLEKYTSDLEIKLKNLTEIHEATVLQLQQNMQTYHSSLLQYQEQIEELKQNHKIESIEQSVENLIMTGSEYLIEPQKTAATQLSSEVSDPSLIEEVIIPKKAYTCQPDSITTDMWSWAEDAELEVKHEAAKNSQYPISLLSPNETQKMKIQDLEDTIQKLELERDRLVEEKQALQVKSGKMMKKLKENKVKIDQLSASQPMAFRKSSSVESNDLDLAIQEEMKSQIAQLEQILSVERSEKSNLAKRMDVLASGNERMVDMKEQQDEEVKRLQEYIRELKIKIKSLEDWSDQPEESKDTAVSISSNIAVDDNDKRSIAELEQEIKDLKIDRDELKDLLDEECSKSNDLENQLKSLQNQLIILENNKSSESEVVALKEKYQSTKAELNELRLKNQNSEMQLNDFQTVIKQLDIELNSMKTNVNQLNEEHNKKVEEHLKLTAELQMWMNKNEILCKKIDDLQVNNFAKNMEVPHEPSLEYENKISELSAQLQYRELEITQLNQRIDELQREDQTASLVQEILVKNQEINLMKQKVTVLENEKLKIENNLSSNLTQNNESTIIHLEETIKNLQIEKLNMEEELRVLNEHVMASISAEEQSKTILLELDMKNIEITELKNSIELMRKQATNQVPDKSNLLEERNAEWEKKYDEIAENWRQHLSIKENLFKENEEKLLATIQELQNAHRDSQLPINTEGPDDNAAVKNDENNSNDSENMQRALENQELEIVTLKEQLALRSAEYARLAAQHDPYAMNSTSSDNVVSSEKKTNNGSNNKSQLDLTLYRLHQRDMRCEELTLELMRLLEERDTLQLKLSNAIRQIEDYKAIDNKEGIEESEKNQSPRDVPDVNLPSTSANILEEKRIELDTKLSQLHSSSYSNKRPLESRERELESIQQDVAKMPSEAVSELVGVDITNTTQSPSSILLNWFWGKSQHENS